jgi:hypothetical protein
MKIKKILLIIAITLSTFQFTFADDIWVSELHVKSIVVNDTTIGIEFKEEIELAPRVFSRWQVKIVDPESASTRVMLSLLLTAKETQKPVRIIIDNAIYDPSSVYSLKEIKMLHYQE